MVWFQCEDCGENLKKPKLPNHFRMCSAYKLSCIDCGQIFSQQSVQGHTQCISEAEKYGPKGEGKASNTKVAKPNNDAKKKPDVDINVGLSERPPWFCSLCNTNATSKQTLLLHADGKKHRAKARAFAAKQQPQQAEEATPNSSVPTENTQKNELPGNMSQDSKENQKPLHVEASSEVGKGCSTLIKKRKLDGSTHDVDKEMAGSHVPGELDNGEVIQIDTVEKEGKKRHKKKAKQGASEDADIENTSNGDAKKIKWKKLIKSALKSAPDGVLKFRKLRKHVTEALRESGFTEDENQISDMLEQKVSSSSKFTVDGKYVRLLAKS